MRMRKNLDELMNWRICPNVNHAEYTALKEYFGSSPLSISRNVESLIFGILDGTREKIPIKALDGEHHILHLYFNKATFDRLNSLIAKSGLSVSAFMRQLIFSYPDEKAFKKRAHPSNKKSRMITIRVNEDEFLRLQNRFGFGKVSSTLRRIALEESV